ncbi:uncharacterized protein A4U43_C07F15180 [Asparagus officinalis]|uniref:NAB domain-containing protein n=1 Tax=Asparagus officinalis TaxID=4686 RepID=A0A5P1EHA5_ASPOF|nr:protein NETWORKED 3A-like [Asparagus officinalis]XP_020274135.1 protein NETWORKED 3A-like [Asparagus officinalis]ONK63440.1 uncharacterized protein A4U43_C07F15180 [Asparagus officinalis]
MTVQEASNLWFFESHNNLKRSQWLQSTLSELEAKTKGMLKLIEGDADTFAQRAEMYYKKRPELVNMIEDFYRSYRSLAERHDQLKFESANSFSNQGFLHKEWGFTDKSSSSSSVLTFDSESEIDDPLEEEPVESKLRELPRIEKEKSTLSTYCSDSELCEEKVESDFKELSRDNSDICVVKQMIEKVESTESLYDELKDGQDKNNVIELSEESERIRRKVNKTTEKIPFVVTNPEEGIQGQNKLKDLSDAKYESIKGKVTSELQRLEEENLALKAELDRKYEDENNFAEISERVLIEEAERIGRKAKKTKEKATYMKVFHPESEEIQSQNNLAVKLMSEVERLKEENLAYKAELERKNEEKREVIRQLSLSMDILKGENDNMKKLIRDSKKRIKPFEFGNLKGVFSRKMFGSQQKFPTTLVAL